MNTIKSDYKNILSIHTLSFDQVNKKYRILALVRLIVGIGILVTLYYSFKGGNTIIPISSICLIIAFIVLVVYHSKLKKNRIMSKTLMDINRDEIDFLEKKNIPFRNGEEFINTSHSFSYDLDLFGENSLFHQLNRTATHIGYTSLSNRLLAQLSNDEIINSHEAIAELGNRVSWRQQVNAIAKMANDNEMSYSKLINWSNTKNRPISIVFRAILFLLPVVCLSAGLIYLIVGGELWSDMFSRVFILNLLVLMYAYKRIKKELDNSSKIDEIIKNYSLILRLIETATFKSKKLISLQKKLRNGEMKSSQQIRKLSLLFSQLDNVSNPIGAIIMNGLSLFHLHILRLLYGWRKQHAKELKTWLDVIGEFETLNSLANFSYNNPSFIFPELNNQHQIEFEDLGHPLIDNENRINNDISFKNQRFVILTGSNMSGKSTFLRSLGVNMVLASSGAPICASSANIHPLPVWVSMRLSDSLNENESYFFAEVKRLKEIMSHADEEVCFVLLDEILRGTNSDDKRLGTVEVIKRLVGNKSIGAIATHDLEVCTTTELYPKTLINKCFEVEIIDDELSFDYKLRDGICKNKSATFLMKKMKVI